MSEEAANSEDAATLQVLKTMDSITAKAQQLQTSLQSLYTEGGFEDLYKGLLDFANNVITYFNNMPKLFDKLPVTAVAVFAQLFANIGGLVTNFFKTLSNKWASAREEYVKGMEDAQSRMTRATQEGVNARQALNDKATANEIKNAEQAATAVENKEQRKTNAASRETNTLQNTQPTAPTSPDSPTNTPVTGSIFERYQQFKQDHAKGFEVFSNAARTAGVSLQILSMAMDQTTRHGEILAGTLNGIGGTLSAVGYAASGHWVMAISVGLTTLMQVLDAFIETAEERTKRLNQEVEDANNKALQSKDELKTLDDYKKKYEQVYKTRNKDADSYKEWIDLNNEIAAKYPELISYIDSEGNSIVSLADNYDRLREAKGLVYNQDFLKQQQAQIAAMQDEHTMLTNMGLENYAPNKLEGQLLIREDDLKAIYSSNTVNEEGIIPAIADKRSGDADWLINTLWGDIFDINTDGAILDKIKPNETLDPNKFYEELYKNQAKVISTIITEMNKGTEENEIKEILKRDFGFNVEDINFSENFSTLTTGKTIQDYIPEYQDQFFDSLFSQTFQQLANFLNVDADSDIVYDIANKRYKENWDAVKDQLLDENGGDLQKAYAQFYSLSQTGGEYDGINLGVEAVMESENELIENLNQREIEELDNLYKTLDSVGGTVVKEGDTYRGTDALDEIQDRFGNLDDELYQQLLGKWYEENKEQQARSIKYIAGIIEPTGLKGWGEALRAIPMQYMDAIVSQYETAARNMETDSGQAKNEISAYTGVLEAIKTELSEEQKNTAYSIISSGDLTSLNGIYEVIDALKEAGIEADLGLTNLANNISVNLVTEFSSFSNAVSKNLEDLEKALSSAAKGMDAKDALEMAQKLDINLQDFQFIDGKYFYSNVEAIKDAYLKYNEELYENLKNDEEALNSAFDSLSESQLKGLNSKSFKNMGRTELRNRLSSSTYFSGLVSEAQLEELTNLYEGFLADIEATNFVDYAREHLSAEADETRQLLDNYVEYQTNSTLISLGQFNEFFKQVLGDNVSDDEIKAAERAIQSGDYSELDESLLPYVNALKEAMDGLTASVLNSAIENVESGGWVARTAENDETLRKLYDKGILELVTDENDQIVGAYLKNLDAIKEALANGDLGDLGLTNEDLASVLQTAHDQEYKNNALDAVSEVVDTYDKVSYEAAQQFILATTGSLDGVKDFVYDSAGNVVFNYEQIVDALIHELAKGEITLTEYNKQLAAAKAHKRELDVDTIVADLIKSRDNISEEQIAALAEQLGEEYNEVSNRFTYSDGAGNRALNLNEIKSAIDDGQLKVSEQTQAMLLETISSIINSFTDLLTNQSDGYTDIQKMGEMVNNLNSRLGTDKYSLSSMFNWNETLGAYTLSREALVDAVKQFEQDMYLMTAEQQKAAKKFRDQSIKELAQNIDIVGLIEAEQGSSDFRELEASVQSYLDVINAIDDTSHILYNGVRQTGPENIINVLKKGGQAAVESAEILAKAADKTLSASDIESIYRGEANKIADSLEMLDYSIGAIINEKANAILTAAGYTTEQIGNTNQYIITGLGNYANTYREYYRQLADTGEAALEELNSAMATALEEDDQINALNALTDAAEMTYEKFAEILSREGIKLTDELIDDLKEHQAIETIGGGKLRILDFNSLAEAFNWNTNSEEYISAFKSYNDSMVELNRKTENNIKEEVSNLLEAKPGDQINLTSTMMELSKDAINAIEQLIPQLGGQLHDGILIITKDTDILGIAKRITEIAANDGALLSDSVAELADAVQDAIRSFIDAISNGLEGKLDNYGALDIKNFAKTQLGIEPEELNFTRTAEGLKLSRESAMLLYQELEKVDRIATGVVMDSLVESLTEADSGMENISQTTARVAELQRELARAQKALASAYGDPKQIESENRKIAALQKELSLTEEIQAKQMQNPESYNFMGRDLPDYLKGPENYWNSVGEAFKAMNTASKTGYMEIQDFYNIVNEMSNLATISGNTLEFMGQKIDGSAENAAAMIEWGLGALSNIDAEGVKIDLSKLGANMVTGAESMGKGFTDALHSMAKSQIDMLDGMISLLETIVAMEELGEIDVDENGIFSIGDIFSDAGKEENADFTEQYHDWAANVLELAETNDDLAKGLDSIKINGRSMRQMIEAGKEAYEGNKKAWEELNMTEQEYFDVIDAFVQAAQNGDYDLDNISQSIWNILDSTLPEGTTLDFGNRTIVISGGNHYEIDWEDENTKEVINEYEGTEEERRQQIIADIQAYSAGEEQDTETISRVLRIQDAYEVIQSEDGTESYKVGDKTYTDQNTALSAAALSAAGYRTTEENVVVETSEDGATTITIPQKIGGFNYLVSSTNGEKPTFSYEGSSKQFNSYDEMIQDRIRKAREDFRHQYGHEDLRTDDEIRQALKIPVPLPKMEIVGGNTESVDTAEFRMAANELLEKGLSGVQEYLNNPDNYITNGDGTITVPMGDAEFTVTEGEAAAEELQNKMLEALGLTNLVTAISTGITQALTDNGDQIGQALGTGILNAINGASATQEQVDAPEEAIPKVNIPEITANVDKMSIGTVASANISGAEEGIAGEITIPEVNAAVQTMKITSVDTTTLAPTESGLATSSSITIPEASGTITQLNVNNIVSTQLNTAEGARTSNITIPTASGDISDLLVKKIDKSHYDSTLTLTEEIAQGKANVANLTVGATSLTASNNLAQLQGLDFSTTSQSLLTLQNRTRNISSQNFSNFGSLSDQLSTIVAQVQTIWDYVQKFANQTFTVTLNQTGGGTTNVTENKTINQTTNSSVNVDTSAAVAACAVLSQAISTMAGALSTAISNVTLLTASLNKIPNKAGLVSNLASAMDKIPSVSSKVSTLATAMSSIPNVAKRITDLNTELGKIPSSKNIAITASVNVSVSGQNATKTGQYPSANTPIKITNAKGNVALAKGRTLMGELGPELVVSGGKYFVVGENGAEFVNLAPDAIVFNHLQTEDLLKRGRTSHANPVTNERKAVSMATGNVSGPAMASASAALAALKQLRAMWQSLLDASAKDLGSLAGSGGGGGGGGGGSDNPVKNQNVLADIERWYNLLRQIEKIEEQISYQESLQNKLQGDRVANGREIYVSYKKELELLDQEIQRNKQLAELQKSWYDNKRKELEESSYGLIFTYDEEGLMQYVDSTPGSGRGLDILENLTSRDVNGQATGHAKTAATQLEYLKSLGFNIEDLLYNDDGTMVAKYNSKGKLVDAETGKKLKGQDLADAQAAMMENFWDNVDGWMDELDSLYDSYHEQEEKVLENQTKQNEILQKFVDNEISIENEILEAIEAREQAEIDKLTKERDALQKSSEKFIQGLNDQLERERNMYQNNKDETELTKLQRQLAILQRSGGSASQIRNLQEQIESKQQDAYFNKQQEQINAIQDASDKQIERLDAQIDLMTETLEYQKENGLLWQEVRDIMNNGTPEQIVAKLQEWDPVHKSESVLQATKDINDILERLQMWTGTRDEGKREDAVNSAAAEAEKKWKDAGLNLPDSVKKQAQDAFDKTWLETGDIDKANAAAKAVYDQAYAKETANNNTNNNLLPTTTPQQPTTPTVPEEEQQQQQPQEEKKKGGKLTIYNGGRMNVRQKPSSKSKSLRTIGEGKYEYTDKSGNWVYLPKYKGWVNGKYGKYTKIKAYDTGGYTGNWNSKEGRMAMLHEKELVLNENDTANLLKAVELLRGDTDARGQVQSFDSFYNAVDLLGDIYSVFDNLSSTLTNMVTNEANQSIVIEEANVNMNVKSIASDYDARRAGETALDQMVKIARKAGINAVSRR